MAGLAPCAGAGGDCAASRAGLAPCPELAAALALPELKKDLVRLTARSSASRALLLWNILSSRIYWISLTLGAPPPLLFLLGGFRFLPQP